MRTPRLTIAGMMVVVKVTHFHRLRMVNASLKFLDEVARLAALSGHCRCPSGRPPEAALPLFGPARGRHWRLGLLALVSAFELAGALARLGPPRHARRCARPPPRFFFVKCAGL